MWPTALTNLQFGSCLLFDGVSQQATIPNLADYSLTTTGALTISIWVRADADPFTNFASSGYVNYFNKDESGGSFHEWCFRLYNSSNTETNLRTNEQDFYLFSPAGGLGASAIGQSSQYLKGNWIHYVGSASSPSMYLYRDGVLQNTANYVTYPVTPGATSALLRLAYSTNNPGYFKGAIGPIKIWNRRLSNQEIYNQYAYNENNTNGLVGYWVADPDNNRLTDLSNNQNHGTLINSPSFITINNQTNFIPIVEPYVNKVALLNGTDQYAYINDSAQAGLNVGTNDFLIAFKAKITNNTAQHEFINKSDISHTSSGSSGARGYDIEFVTTAGGEIRFSKNDTTGANSTNYINPQIFDDEYHDIVIVSARSTNISQIYVDGVRYVNGSGGPTGSFSSNGALRIGVRQDTTNWFLPGGIGNIFYYVWSTIPSDYYKIIEDLHFVGETNYTYGLVSSWLFNGDATDSAGPNDLTSVGDIEYDYISDFRAGIPTTVWRQTDGLSEFENTGTGDIVDTSGNDLVDTFGNQIVDTGVSETPIPDTEWTKNDGQ